MAKTKETEMTQADMGVLHVVGEHLASNVLPELSRAAMEAQAFYKETNDDRFKQIYEVIEKVITPITDVSRSTLESVPGVVIPTVEELSMMIAEAKAEQEFMKLVAQEQEVLH